MVDRAPRRLLSDEALEFGAICDPLCVRGELLPKRERRELNRLAEVFPASIADHAGDQVAICGREPSVGNNRWVVRPPPSRLDSGGAVRGDQRPERGEGRTVERAVNAGADPGGTSLEQGRDDPRRRGQAGGDVRHRDAEPDGVAFPPAP